MSTDQQTRPKHFIPLTRKISFLVLGCSLLTLTIYASVAIFEFKRDKLRYIHLMNSAYTAAIVQKLEANISGNKRDMRTIIDYSKQHGPESDYSKVIKAVFQGNSQFISYALYSTKDGGEFQERYALYNKNLVMRNGRQTEDYRAACAKAVAAAGRQDSTSTYLATHVVRVFTLDRLEALSACFVVSNDFLRESIAEVTVSESFITDRTGAVVAHRNVDEIGKDFSSNGLVKPALGTTFREGGGEYRETNGRAYISHYALLGDDLILFSYVDKAQAMAGVRVMMMDAALFAVVVAAIAIIIGLYFATTVTRPLFKLMDATEEIAAGHYKLKLDVKTNDELQQLANCFTSLGEKLDEREAQLAHATDLASRDGLTGLHNHRYFRSQLSFLFGIFKRHHRSFSAMLIDIDHFKKVNDVYGHEYGNKVICALGDMLKSECRHTDVVARYGGEEFICLLPETERENARILGERVRTKMAAIEFLDGNNKTFHVTISVGIADVKERNFENGDQLVELSDERLYSAKRGGRDQVVAA